jgi:hypothetical protein
MLLVMSTHDLFKIVSVGESGEGTPSVSLWADTWVALDEFMPTLREELFPVGGDAVVVEREEVSSGGPSEVKEIGVEGGVVIVQE